MGQPPHMRAYILRTGTRLAPFGDDVGDTLIQNQRLADYQTATLRRCLPGAEVTIVGSLAEIQGSDFLLVEDSLFFSPHLLRKALKAARRQLTAGPLRIALSECLYIHEKSALGGLELQPSPDDASRSEAWLPMWLWRGRPFSAATAAAELAAAPRLPIAIAERTFEPPNLRLLGDNLHMLYSITREGALSLRHWSHILDANQLALAAFWMDFSPLRVLRYAAQVLSALSFNKHRIAQHVNFIGRGCDIHPTAFVAGSVLGDNVSVGPNSVIFGSVLGSGSQVESLSEVALSTIGEGAVVSFRTRIFTSVLYPNSMASYPAMQMCLLGRRAMHMGGCFPIDMKLSLGAMHDVKVRHQGRVVPSGKKFLGICVGHRSIVGTGLWVNSGVEVPNDSLIVRDLDDIVTKIPEGMAGRTLYLRNGALHPFERPAPVEEAVKKSA